MTVRTCDDLVDLLRCLWSRDLPEDYDSVSSGRSADVLIRRHVQIFLQYKPYVRRGLVLDWGCRHAPDTCLLRATTPTGLSLHGCDVDEPHYPASLGYAGLEHRRLEHPWRLPYDDETFDTIIGSGVLEHVPSDGDSLRELTRVLRPRGRLIITFLPNRLSYTEMIARRLGLLHHDRLYDLGGFRRMLLAEGLRPLRTGLHQLTPSLAGKVHRLGRMGPPARRAAERLFPASRAMERVWPICLVAANIWAVAEKPA